MPITPLNNPVDDDVAGALEAGASVGDAHPSTHIDQVTYNEAVETAVNATITLAEANETALDGNAAADLLARANHTGTQAASTITGLPVEIGIACSNLTDTLTTGTTKAVVHAPFAFTLTEVIGGLGTASSSGVFTFDVNKGAGTGTSVLSTKLEVDANEETSNTAATPAVISTSAFAKGDRITIDFDTVGTGAKAAVVWLIGTRT